jgi:3-phosphoshikimate 1-carboxyvinyltransferase
LNPTRTGILAVLLRMGAKLREEEQTRGPGEPCGRIEIVGRALRGTEIGGAEIPNVIDELPVLAVAGALAGGTTVIKDAAELRVKESDRLAVVARHLTAMGADVTEHPDGLEIRGGRPLHGARLASHGDHRIAMAFAIAGLFADGETVIENASCVETSYPGFAGQLERIAHGRR